MLMQYEIDDQMNEEDLMEILGLPLATPRIRTIDGRPPVRAPRRLVEPVDLTSLALSTPNKIAIVDFGCSYTLPRYTDSMGIPLGYSAPEVLLQPDNGATGGPSDIWSLACSITAAVTGSSPISHDHLHAIQAFELLMGPLPEPLRTFWKESLGTAVETNLGRMERLLKQPPEATNLLAPVSLSTDELKKMRVEWEEETGYTEYLKYVLSQVQYFYPSNILKASEIDYTEERTEDERSSDQRSTDSDEISDNCIVVYDPWSPKNQPNPQEETRLTQAISSNMEIAEKYGNKKPPSDSHSECPTDEDSLLRVGDESPPSSPAEDSESLQPSEIRQDSTSDGNINYGRYRLSYEEVETISDLLYQMFKYDPKERITAREVLNHEWFRGLREVARAKEESRDGERDRAPKLLKAGKGKPKRPAPSAESPCKWARSSDTGRLRRVED